MKLKYNIKIDFFYYKFKIIYKMNNNYVNKKDKLSKCENITKNKKNNIDDNYVFEVILNLKKNINYANNKLIKEIFNIYFSKLTDKKISFEEFKKSIHKNKKSDVNSKISNEELQKLLVYSDDSDNSDDSDDYDDSDNSNDSDISSNQENINGHELDSEEVLDSINRCKYLVYNKGNIRHCLKKKMDNNDFCYFHYKKNQND